MRKKPHEPHTLVEPQHALRAYLDDMLGEETLVAEPEPVNTDIADAVLAKELERATTEIPIDETPVVDLPTADISAPAEAETSVASDKSSIQTRISTPDWAEAPFQCLSFQVAGVTLAAPLEKLNGIVEVEEEITELPGYAPWVIGLLPNRGKNVQVVDVAQIIMPNEDDLVKEPTAERMKFIILLDEGRFGLAADSISQVLSLKADMVRWRGEQSKRPWLAGTVIEQMCALLEVDLLVDQLRAGLEGV